MPPLQLNSRKAWLALITLGAMAFALAAAPVGLLDQAHAEAGRIPSGMPLDQLKLLFKRPHPDPAPIGAAAEQVALGARLFAETKLSASQAMSCATCHDPDRGFVDGRRTARGNDGRPLTRNTPALWNLATARSFYWDGRAPTLEAQIKDAIERDGEMAGALDVGVQRLLVDPAYVRAFQSAFAGPAPVSGDNVLKAIASYERTLVSPVTRFDRWIAGAADALTARELAGFKLFAGKGRCLACHGGWRFTDDGVHDIGLSSNDRGRAAITGGAGRTFKTPSLREAVWTAPYMHDGSLRRLEDVVAHYAGKLDPRQSLAPELKRGISLSKSERRDLVAFLRTLSGPRLPRAVP
jgi:cytochrome c peroxidase